jgi:hypothetical protein
MQPDHLKQSHFMRFVKDCQIISERVSTSQIELELAKVVRKLRGGDVRVGGLFLSFDEFLASLEVLAPRVYPGIRAEVACKRLLMENVFLLAGRRNDIFSLDTIDEEATNLTHSTYAKSLQDIFQYYLDMAEKRRNNPKGNCHQSSRNVEKGAKIQGKPSGKKKKSAKNTIGYSEYMAFCLDFSLKSTTLLTGIQVGDIYLNIVPMNPEIKKLDGMSFEVFCTSLLYMAILAFRLVECQDITPSRKVKALFIFMWKAVNQRDKMRKLAMKTSGAVGNLGTLNCYGSMAFSDQVLRMWRADDFVDYVEPIKSDKWDKGRHTLDQITDYETRGFHTPHEEVLDIVNRLDPKLNGSTEGISHGKMEKNMNSDFAVSLNGKELGNLLRRHPEFAELLSLEIKSL